MNALGSATPFNTVTVRSRIDGQLLRVTFQEGQFVRQGDPLAEIDPKPFEVQLEQARGQLARDQAQLNNAKLDLARYQTLAAQGVIPRQQLDTQASNVKQFDGVIRADEAQINTAKLQISYCHIVAPIGGRVGLRMADAGNMIHANDANGLVVIAQIQPIAVLFTIPEDSLPQVLARLRQGASLPVEAWNRDNNAKIATGRLTAVDNRIDPETGTAELKAVFENKDGKTWQPIKVSAVQPPESGPTRIVLKARTQYAWSNTSSAIATEWVRYGIESYFVPQGQGSRLETLARDKKLAARIAVDGRGNAAIKGLLIDGVEQYSEPLF